MLTGFKIGETLISYLNKSILNVDLTNLSPILNKKVYNILNNTLLLNYEIIRDLLSLNTDILKSFITTINGVLPHSNGNVDFLDSSCISIISRTDPSFTLVIKALDWPLYQSDAQETSYKNNNTLFIYDGCRACVDCQDIWNLQLTILELHLWVVGMKDCILYNLNPAEALWALNITHRIYNSIGILNAQKAYLEFSDSTVNAYKKLDLNVPSLYFLISPINTGCYHKYEITNNDYRKLLFDAAYRMLYQYKATVALWNYFCFLKTQAILIILASLDWSGFVIQTKKRINNCGRSTKSLKLIVRVQLQDGQTAWYLKGGSLGTIPLLNDAARLMQLFVTCPSLNTFLEKGTDTGGQSGIITTAIKPQLQLLFPGTLLYILNSLLCSDSLDQDASTLPVLQAVFDFTDLLYLDLNTASASLKILPFITYKNLVYSETSLIEDVQVFTSLRMHSTDIHSSEHSRTNRWKVDLIWYSLANTEDSLLLLLKELCIEATETRYYTSGFCKYPSALHEELE